MRYRDLGLLIYDRDKATAGFTLIVPLAGKAAYLIGMRGEILHQWSFPMTPGNYAYLLPNGNLLWSGRTEEGPPMRSGKGGLLREYDWSGKVVWEYRDPAQHHDFRRTESGNTVYIGWEPIPDEFAQKIKGGRTGSERDGVIYGDFLKEVDGSGKVVWEWHAYSDMELEKYVVCGACNRDEFAHANACCPLPDGDVMVSFRRLNLVAIVERRTRRFRWEMRDDSWGHQHDCTMLSNENILLFANGIHQPVNPYSRVIELNPKTKKVTWQYRGTPIWTFFSPNISGAQRLPGGNTLICEGLLGRVFEVTPEGEIVWEYISPFFAPYEDRGPGNNLFRAYRYLPDSPEVQGRVERPAAW